MTKNQYAIRPKQVPTFYFIGVTTAQSFITKIFSPWVEELGHPNVVLEGVDLRLHDTCRAYRQAVAQIKYDANSLGALVTSHKIDLFNAAGDMFDYLDPQAQICGEVSAISKQNGALQGHAVDPITSGYTLEAMLGQNYFAKTGGNVLCLGAGGAATAIALSFISRLSPGNRPRKFIAVDRLPARLEHLKKMVNSRQTAINFEYLLNESPARNDEIMADLPPGSMVINATGMGKDRPGSPITDAGRFPANGIAWELNYRGARQFMHQALAQKEGRNVRVEDGWLYFLHGWTQVMARVLHLPIEGDVFNRLAAIAQARREEQA